MNFSVTLLRFTPILKSMLLLLLVSVAVIILASRFWSYMPYQLFAVESGSMAPQLPRGSLVLVKTHPKPEHIDSGTIILFPAPGYRSKLISHRVERVVARQGKPWFVTKGDANVSVDPWTVSSEAVQGRYVGHLPHLGRGITFLQSRIGTVAFIALPLLVIALLEVRLIMQILIEKRLAALHRFDLHGFE